MERYACAYRLLAGAVQGAGKGSGSQIDQWCSSKVSASFSFSAHLCTFLLWMPEKVGETIRSPSLILFDIVMIRNGRMRVYLTPNVDRRTIGEMAGGREDGRGAPGDAMWQHFSAGKF